MSEDARWRLQTWAIFILVATVCTIGYWLTSRR